MTDNKSPPYRAEFTADIIRLVNEGAAPWQKPWDAGEFGRTPYNPTTMKPYRGGNTLSLMITGMRRGYADPRYCTYKQAQEQGWQVRKGEKATHIEFWDIQPGKKREEDDEDKLRMIHRVYSVFNAQQIEGIPALVIEPRKPFEIIEAGESILKNSGADIRHGGAHAFYRPSGDYIQMPPKDCFTSEPKYYQTALHELTHWTGAKHRLDRLVLNAPFGSPEYAKEEIRADLGSLFLSAETGIPYDPTDQAGYIQHWVKVLEGDINEIFRAASDAGKAADYILAFDKTRAKPQDIELLGNSDELPVTHAARLAESRPVYRTR
jgi:antirestriction protein ArdC